MKKSKRIQSYAIMLLCAVMCMGGCGKTKSSATSSGIKVSGVNEFPISEEPVTLSVFAVKNPYIENFDTNEFTKFYEEKTNVHIEWNVATGDARQAFNLMLASGEYSDLIMGMYLTKSEQLSYAQQGIVIDLKDYIDEYGHYIKQMFENEPDVKEGITINDAIYGLPVILKSYRATYRNMMWTYKPWMEKLGLEIPQNTEDFYQMLKAFKEKDPNGNGIADEIPLAARGVGANQGIESYLMSAFIPDGGTRCYVEDGKVKITAVQPEYREGLRYIKKLYDEGLLYNDTFILDRSQIMAIGENQPTILGSAPGMFPGMFTISNGNSQRYYEYTAIPPLEGPNGVRAVVKDSIDDSANFLVTKTCKYPEVAVKWVDWFYSDEGKKESQIDAKDSVTRDAQPGELGVDGEQAKWTTEKTQNTASNDSGMAQNRNWHNFGVYYTNFERSIKTCNQNDVLDPHREWYKAYDAYKEYGVENFLGDMPIAPEDLEDYSEIRVALQEIDTAFASFVIGDMSIDNDWDSYIETLNKKGLQRYLEILQKSYDSMKK